MKRESNSTKEQNNRKYPSILISVAIFCKVNHRSDIWHTILVLSFCVLHINGMVQYTLFCIWVSFHDTVFAWLIHFFAPTIYLFYSFWAIILLSIFEILSIILLKKYCYEYFTHHFSAHRHTILFIQIQKWNHWVIDYTCIILGETDKQIFKVVVAIPLFTSI